MPETAITIRESRDADIPAIARIYAHHVLHGLASFEEVPPSVGEIGTRRVAILERGLPYLIAERAGQVIGYCYAGPYRPRSGYRFTLEDSIYIAPDAQNKGVGRVLLERWLRRIRV